MCRVQEGLGVRGGILGVSGCRGLRDFLAELLNPSEKFKTFSLLNC